MNRAEYWTQEILDGKGVCYGVDKTLTVSMGVKEVAEANTSVGEVRDLMNDTDLLSTEEYEIAKYITDTGCEHEALELLAQTIFDENHTAVLLWHRVMVKSVLYGFAQQYLHDIEGCNNDY